MKGNSIFFNVIISFRMLLQIQNEWTIKREIEQTISKNTLYNFEGSFF